MRVLLTIGVACARRACVPQRNQSLRGRVSRFGLLCLQDICCADERFSPCRDNGQRRFWVRSQ
jgi:hypothetical protein